MQKLAVLFAALIPALYACVAEAGPAARHTHLGSAAYSGAREVALSFDDGPDKVLTPELLDMLKGAGVTATFCLVGERVAASPEIVRRIQAEGHELCNHSWDHRILTRANVRQEIARTDAAIESATGTRPAILRAPYGDIRSTGRCFGGRPFVMWEDDTMDWKYRTKSHIVPAALGARSEDIVLMHDIHPASVASVPAIIAGLKAKGFTFVHASKLWKHHCTHVASGS